MDLSESKKLSKSSSSSSALDSNLSSSYVTEKLYMLLQLYLQNKGWNPSLELLQCFSELKDAAMLPSAAYLQMMAQRVSVDSQGRLVLQKTGKIILPYEHFANAVMLKHMNGPQGHHLSLEATIRAVTESYTIGRDQFGMDKEYIIEVVQNCPNPACRYFKNQLEVSHRSYLPEPPTKKSKVSASSSSTSDPFHAVDLSAISSISGHSSSAARAQLLSAVHAVQKLGETSKGVKSKLSAEEHKMAEILRNSLDSFDGFERLSSSNKDLLALHNGAWGAHDNESKRSASTSEAGQEKIVRAYSEMMNNIARMKTCIRPSMCKPYGKQSESLQKTLMDTIQMVQSLRQALPPTNLSLTSWKSEDKHGDLSRKID